MWEGFVLHHGVPVLPAEPEHVAAFVVARWRAGVSDAALAANLSAVLWFHRELAGTCDVAKRVLGVLRRRADSVIGGDADVFERMSETGDHSTVHLLVRPVPAVNPHD